MLTSWLDISDTETLVCLLKDQMSDKSHIENDSLSIRISFGCAKSGMEFVDQDNFDEYTEIKEGVGDHHIFSESKDKCSPYVQRFGSTKINNNWSKPIQITKLVSSPYTSEGCKLHYDF